MNIIVLEYKRLSAKYNSLLSTMICNNSDIEIVDYCYINMVAERKEYKESKKVWKSGKYEGKVDFLSNVVKLKPNSSCIMFHSHSCIDVTENPRGSLSHQYT